MSTASNQENVIGFAGFTLDPAGPELRRDGQVVPLRPKSLALMVHLASRPGQLVRKEDLVNAVWGNTAVTDATLARTLFDAREALGDDSRAPRFIETVHRLGFRFLADTDSSGRQAAPAPDADGRLSGRLWEREQLRRWRDLAATGNRQTIFLVGEAGIGKTSILEAFLADSLTAAGARPGGVLLARGQCIEHYGTAEAYLPFLDALGELCRGPAAATVVPVLRRVAPTWLAQLPWLIDGADRADLERELRGVTADRMLRELAQALETISEHRLVILALEDLHWSDSATTDLLSYLGRRSGPARLLVIATYRPVEAIVADKPIRSVHQELQRQNRSQSLVVDTLAAEEVADLVGRRFHAAAFAEELSVVVQQRTEGHPLFIVSMLDDLIAQGRITNAPDGWQLNGAIDDLASGLPADLLQMVHSQVDRLAADERAAVEAASVAGATFSAASVAAALQRDVVDVEDICEAMARRGMFLERAGASDWADGTTASAYAFRHAIYGDALYRSLSTSRRRRYHERIGERLEVAWRCDPTPMASALGMHFEEAGDHRRAALYLRQAAEVAARRGAPNEAVALVARAREHLVQLPVSIDRTVEELMLEMAAGPALAAVLGYASDEVEQIFARAREHCRTLGDGAHLFPVLWGLWAYTCVRGRIGEALGMAQQVFDLAKQSGDRMTMVEGHHAMWVTTYFRGDLGECGRHLDAGLALYDRRDHHAHVMMFGQDAGVVGHSYRCLVRAAQGRTREAVEDADAAIELGRSLGHHISLIFAVGFKGWMYQDLGDAERCRPLAGEVLELASSNGLSFWHAHGIWTMGRALAADDPAAGIPGMRAGIEALRGIGAEMTLPGYLATLAETVLTLGDRAEARRLVEEAWKIGELTGEWLARADILRIRGDLERGEADAEASSRAEGLYQQALETARHQEVPAVELRCALSLARLLRDQSRSGEAAALLERSVASLAVEDETDDLREARAHLGA